MLAKAIGKILNEEEEEVLIPCTDKKNQESIRVMLFHLRKKLRPDVADAIAISKLEDKGIYFVRVYKKALQQLYKRGVDGELMLITETYDTGKEREIMLMRKDGLSEEEIKERL